jgi:CDP-diacylglycerol--serine O-phosphatidyltransferase
MKHIPNALTCCNLLCGCLGILGVIEGWAIATAWFIWIACVFDFLDGFSARLLNVSSPIGKELDSLADMVTFGVLPGMLMLSMMKGASPNEWVPYAALLIPVCSALRLAKFNVDARQVSGFIGLPTPANALFISALPFVPDAFDGITWGIYGLLAITVIFSWLMVSPLKLFALKFSNFGWSDNALRFTFVGISVLLIVFLGKSAVAISILLYIGLSLWIAWRTEGTVSK